MSFYCNEIHLILAKRRKLLEFNNIHQDVIPQLKGERVNCLCLKYLREFLVKLLVKRDINFISCDDYVYQNLTCL